MLASYAYTVNATGDRTKVVHNDSSSVEYEYDNRRRLIRERHLNAAGIKFAEWRYTYDGVGNRVSMLDIAGSETSYYYDAADRLLKSGLTTYSYDARGNLVSRAASEGVTQYEFGNKNELIRVKTPSGEVGFSYDAGGERMSSTGPAGEFRYLIDSENSTGVSQVLAEYDGSFNVRAEYTYGHELIDQTRGGVRHFYHRDGSRNIRHLTNASGEISDSYVYNAFGERINVTGATANPYQFAGERWGEFESLTYLRARYYDPATGRFVGRDPFEGVLRDPVSLHRYLYANANPVAFTDPTGRFTQADLAVAQSLMNAAKVGLAASLATTAIAGINQFATFKKVKWKKLADLAVRTFGIVTAAVFFAPITAALTSGIVYMLVAKAVNMYNAMVVISKTRDVYIQDFFNLLLVSEFIGSTTGRANGAIGELTDGYKPEGILGGVVCALVAEVANQIVGVDIGSAAEKLLEEGPALVKPGSSLNKVIIPKGKPAEFKAHVLKDLQWIFSDLYKRVL